MNSFSAIPHGARIYGHWEHKIFIDFIHEIKRRGFVLHHKATFGTHFSRRAAYTYVTPYRGKFGNGFIVHLPSNDNSRPNSHPIFYYIIDDKVSDTFLKNLLFND